MNWTLCVLDFGGAKLGRKGKHTGKMEFFNVAKERGRNGFQRFKII